MQSLKRLLRKDLPYRQHNIIFIIICINVGIHLLTLLAGGLSGLLGLIPIRVQQGELWRLVTYMFVHGDFWHIFFNMILLYFCGLHFERRLGSWEFLLFYLLAGTLAGVASVFLYGLTGSVSINIVGASGAVYAVMIAFAVFYPDARVIMFPGIPMRASVFVLIYVAKDVFGILSGNSGVAYLTHLAGLCFALLYFPVRLGMNPIKILFDRYRRRR